MRVPIQRNIISSYLNWAISIALPLVMIPIYLRCLGHQTYGAWIVILSVTSYLGLANLGIGQTLNNRVAESVAKDRHGEIGPLVSTAFFGYAAIAAALTLALVASAPLIAKRFALDDNYSALAPFLIYTTLVLVSFPFKVFPCVLRGFERVDLDQSIIAAANTVRVAILALALLSGAKLIAVAAINGSAELLMPMATYWMSRRLTSEATPRLRNFSRTLLGAMIRPSLGFLGIQVANALMLGVDNLVVGYALGAAAVTAYAVPFRLITMLVSLFSVAVNAVNPTVTVTFAQGMNQRLARGYLFSLRLAMFYATAGAIVLWIVGPRFLRVWAGPDVFPGFRAYSLMILFFIMVVSVIPSSSILWATTRHYVWSFISIAEGVLNLVLSLWMVRRFGLAGVVGGTVIASTLLTLWYLPYAAFRTLGISIRSAAREMAPGFVVSALALAAVVTLWNPRLDASLLYATGAGTIAILAYVVAFGCVGFSREQRLLAIGWLIPSRRQESAA